MDMPAERAGLHLMDELREMEADGRYKVKVRVHAPQYLWRLNAQSFILY